MRKEYRKDLGAFAAIMLFGTLAACGDDVKTVSTTETTQAAAPTNVEDRQTTVDSRGNSHTTVTRSQAYQPVPVEKTTVTQVRDN